MIFKNVFGDKFIGAASAACLMSVLSGIATRWPSPVIPKLQTVSEDNPFDQPVTVLQSSWMTSLVTLGACMGCCIFGLLAHSAGRRFSMCTLSLPMIISYVMMIAFPKIEVYYVARILAGLTVGGGQIVAMTYNSEITSKHTRGVFMTFTSMMVGVGSLFCYSVGPWVSVKMFNIISIVFPIVTAILALLFCMETPYFYLLQNKEDLAKISLLAYRGSNMKVDEEISKIKENIKEQQTGNLLDVIKSKAFLKSFIIATTLFMFQQLSGIDAIVMYSQSIFKTAGSNLPSAICSIIFGVMQIMSGAIAPLVTMKFNRKTLLTVSSIGIILAETILGIYCILRDSGTNVDSFKFIPVSTLCFFVLSFNLGMGPLCWLVSIEVYSTRIKTLAMAFSVVIYHVLGFFISQYYHSVEALIGMGPTFIIFAGFCFLCILFIQFYVIETKGKSLEEIQNILTGYKAPTPFI